MQTTYLKHLFLTKTIREKIPEVDAVNPMYTTTTRTEPDCICKSLAEEDAWVAGAACESLMCPSPKHKCNVP